MKRALAAVFCFAVVLGAGCSLDPAEVVHVKWETETTYRTFYTATFKNVGNKPAKNVYVVLWRPDNTGGEGNTFPSTLQPGHEGRASIAKRTKDTHPADSNTVVSITWDD